MIRSPVVEEPSCPSLVIQPEASEVLIAKAGIPDSRFTFKFATHLKCCYIFTISSNYGPPNISPRIGYRRSIPEENDIVQDSPAWHLDHESHKWGQIHKHFRLSKPSSHYHLGGYNHGTSIRD